MRVNKLIEPHKNRLDNGEIAFRVAVSLSYLLDYEQQLIDDILSCGNYKLDMKKAEVLRQLSAKGKLTAETADDVFVGKASVKKSVRPAFKLKLKIISKYFSPEQKPDEIEGTIIEALEYYYANVKSKA